MGKIFIPVAAMLMGLSAAVPTPAGQAVPLGNHNINRAAMDCAKRNSPAKPPKNPPLSSPERIKPWQVEMERHRGEQGCVPELEKVGYLGIATSTIGPKMRRQNKLPAGAGLKVDFVEPDSPAEKAGVRVGDILYMLNDQLLVDPEQASTLVRSFKAGDEITLKVIHEKALSKLKAKLVAREIPTSWIIREVPPPDVPRLQDVAENDWDSIHIRKPGQQVDVTLENGIQINWSDDKHVLALTQFPKSRRLIARDLSGKQLFAGPIDTPEQRDAMPEEIAEKLTKLEESLRKQIEIAPDRGRGREVAVAMEQVPEAVKRTLKAEVSHGIVEGITRGTNQQGGVIYSASVLIDKMHYLVVIRENGSFLLKQLKE